jgi:prepilin-type N-terminal cleavage/methylation domain-containing protein
MSIPFRIVICQGIGLFQHNACVQLSARHIAKLTFPPSNCPLIPTNRAYPVNLILFRHQLDFQYTSATLSIRSSPADRMQINRHSSQPCRGISYNFSKLLEPDFESGNPIAEKKFVKPGLHVNDPHRLAPLFLPNHTLDNYGSHKFLPERTTPTTMMSSAICNPIHAMITVPVQNMDSSLIEVISDGNITRLGINWNTVNPVFYNLRGCSWDWGGRQGFIQKSLINTISATSFNRYCHTHLHHAISRMKMLVSTLLSWYDIPQKVNTGGTGPTLPMTKLNHRSTPLLNRDGFTLIEIIVVLVILSVLCSIAVQRVIALDSVATQRFLECAVTELNSRECLTWAQVKTSPSSWVNDAKVFAGYDANLGPEYKWGSKTPDGGTLNFKGQEVKLERSPSTSSESGSWKMK